MRMRTVVHPLVQKSKAPITSIADYISLPAVDTYGTWKMKDLIPAHQLAALARLANRL